MDKDTLQRHYAQAYGRKAEASRADVALRLLKKTARFERGTVLRVLDVGGGDMQLARRFISRLEAAMDVSVCLEGWDLSEEGVRRAAAAGEQSCVRSISDPLPEDDIGRYDLALFFEVLEHLVDTDTAVQNLRRLLKPEGRLLLSTPNLAGWMDRLSLLFGMQPHTMEVSFAPYRFGNPLVRRLLPHGPDDPAAGHLRLFTLRALKEFLVWHGFRPVQTGGCVNHSFDFISRCLARWWPGIVGNVVVLATPDVEKNQCAQKQLRRHPDG